ncbi:MAG: hypothetical protein HGB35_03890 [Geobacteraceae bacterium]|nr:hypothetical protein [Geobacteraceae bacterium]
MKKFKEFNWDKYIRTETYDKVLDGMGLSRPLMPTMFSPDKKLIYLKTYDVAFETDNAKILNSILEELFVSLRNEARKIVWSCERLYLLQVDYMTIWRILCDIEALPDDYQYPEYYLEEVMKMICAGRSPGQSNEMSKL